MSVHDKVLTGVVESFGSGEDQYCEVLEDDFPRETQETLQGMLHSMIGKRVLITISEYPSKPQLGVQSAELEQAYVQLAGCLTAAEGAIREPAKQGDYGWSLAYQKVLELRIEYEKRARYGL